jgi:hypothetical protein
MAKGTQRTTILNEKSNRQLDKANRSDSKYGRKKQWLDRKGLYGFQVPEPKPWK